MYSKFFLTKMISKEEHKGADKTMSPDGCFRLSNKILK